MWARAGGAAVLALTNAVGSALAGVADEVVGVRAGVETAVAATKTYTGELLALAALFGTDEVVADLPSLERKSIQSQNTVGAVRDRQQRLER